MCDKTTPEGDVSYVDLEDESMILSRLADVVPESRTAKTLFEVPTLHVYARLLTTRAHYRSADLDLTIDCTLLAMNRYVLHGTVRAKNRATLDAIRGTLAAYDVLPLGQGAVVRSKVVEYVRRNNKPLSAKLLEWGVVTQEGCVECPVLEQPALVMSPTLFC